RVSAGGGCPCPGRVVGPPAPGAPGTSAHAYAVPPAPGTGSAAPVSGCRAPRPTNDGPPAHRRAVAVPAARGGRARHRRPAAPPVAPAARRGERQARAGTAISPRATGTTWPVTVAETAAPAAAVTVHSNRDGRPLSAPCRTEQADSPSGGSSPDPTSQTPSPSAADPVAGSSGTPSPGTKTRTCASRREASQLTTHTRSTA